MTPSRTDYRAIEDLAAFARLEVESGDIEPWAAVLRQMAPVLGPEGTAWAVKLYNAYDDLGSAFRLFSACSGPYEWALEPSPGALALAAQLPCGGERRNLRGGLVVKHLNSYTAALRGGSQMSWLREPVPSGSTRADGFEFLMKRMRREVWGTGRLAAFEWAEFSGKVLGLPVQPDDGCLWESSGPRESLERIFNGGEPAPSQTWLDQHASVLKMMLSCRQVTLDWWDLETVICDFNVMRKGRYYPGKHLAMIREEIEGLGAGPVRRRLRAAFTAVIPSPWHTVPPGADKALAAVYKQDGVIRTPFGKAV